MPENKVIPREKQVKLLSKSGKLKKLYAKDAMIKPIMLLPDESSESILRKLRKEHINACIVVTRDGKFIGEISDNDIIKLFLQQTRFEPLVKVLNLGYRREFLYEKAEDLANRHKYHARLDTPVNKVIKLLNKKGSEYVPVLDNDGRVIGVVTPSSLINLLRHF